MIGTCKTVCFVVVVIITIMVLPGPSSASASGFPLAVSDGRIQSALDFIRNSYQDQRHSSLWAGGEKTCYAIAAIEACGGDAHTFTDAEDTSLIEIIRGSAPHYLAPQPDASLPHEFFLFAIVAAGENPHDFSGIDVVQQLKDMYDGNQIGKPGIINDDFWGIIALVGAGENPGSGLIQTCKNHILANQSQDGSWGCTAGGGGGDPCDTANAIMALRAAGESPSSAAIQHALDYLKSQQNSDGGFPYSNGSASDTGSDARVIAALYACGVDPTGSSWSVNGHNAVTHALSQQNTDGGFSWTSGHSDAWMTSYLMPALVGKHWPPDLFKGKTSSSTTNPNPSSSSGSTANPSISIPATDTTAPSIPGTTPWFQQTISTTRPLISATYSDSGSGIDIRSVILKVDNVDVSHLATVTAGRVTFEPASDLGAGTHTAEIIVCDGCGNRADYLWQFYIGSIEGSSSAVDVSGSIDPSGILIETIILNSDDAQCSLYLEGGARLLGAERKTVEFVDIRTAADVQVTSKGSYQIGPIYALEPQGLAFDTPARISITYQEQLSGDSTAWDINGDGSVDILDMMRMRDAVWKEIEADSFCVAYYDIENNEWVDLPGSSVDTDIREVTVELACFAPVTILAITKTTEPIGYVAYVPPDSFTSIDGMAHISLTGEITSPEYSIMSAGTTGLSISENVPDIPEPYCRIGLAYDVLMDPACLENPANITLRYQETALSGTIRWDTNGDGMLDLLDDAVVAAPEKFSVGFFNEHTESWQFLPSEVDRTSNTVKAEISEPGTYAIVGPAALPLVVNRIEIPQEVKPGKETFFRVYVRNPGQSEGTYLISLTIDGITEHLREVTLAPGEHEILFTHTEPYIGPHEVEVLGETAMFTANPVSTNQSKWWDSVDIVLYLYLIIGLSCVAVIVGVILFTRMRRRDPERTRDAENGGPRD